jgi:hypothetical protein
MTSTKSVEQRLAAAAKQVNRDREAAEAVREYAAEKARVDANTARLRALRLEKEAAEAQAAPPAKPPARKKAASQAKPKSTASRTRTSA